MVYTVQKSARYSNQNYNISNKQIKNLLPIEVKINKKEHEIKLY